MPKRIWNVLFKENIFRKSPFNYYVPALTGSHRFFSNQK